MDLIIAFIAVLLGSFFAAVSGFGFALVTTPLLCLAIPPKEAIVLLPILTIVLRIVTMFNVWGKFDQRTVGLVLLGYMVGVYPGAFLLKIISAARLEILLGVVLMLVTFVMSRGVTVNIKNKTFGRITAGFCGSCMGTATSVNGPPIILYFMNEKLDKTIMRANLIWIFGVGAVASVMGNLLMGNMKEVTDWNHLYSMIPAVLVGTYFGEKCFKYLDQKLFYKIALIVVFMGGLLMLAQGIRASL